MLKIDTSNMADVYYRRTQINQDDLLAAVDNIKPDRTAEDLLFQVLLDWGVDLTLPIRARDDAGQDRVLRRRQRAGRLLRRPASTRSLVKELAGASRCASCSATTASCRDAVKINVEQIFKQLSPATEVKSI